MRLEARHYKVIALLNKETFVDVDYSKSPTMSKAIDELYARNKILIGCRIGGRIASLKLSKRILDYSKKII